MNKTLREDWQLKKFNNNSNRDAPIIGCHRLDAALYMIINDSNGKATTKNEPNRSVETLNEEEQPNIDCASTTSIIIRHFNVLFHFAAKRNIRQ